MLYESCGSGEILMLPGIDGFGVCKEIRKEGNIPIVIMSAKVEKQDIDL